MDNRATAMNYLALRQTIQGKMIVIGNAPAETEQEENKVCRIIQGAPVYHISSAYLNFDRLFMGTTPPKLWASFYHPFLMMGMPDIGGEVKIYIDTRFEGYYVMTAAVKLDAWANGTSKRALDVVCWTPKQPKETIAIAGQRLIRSLIYNMDGLDDNETTNPIFENEDWQDEWNPSTNILGAFIEVRGEEDVQMK